MLPLLQPKKHIKSIVYGGVDGIITVFSIVASTSGASLSAGILLIMGCANLLADALSMSVSDYLSSRAEIEYQQSREQSKLNELSSDSEAQLDFLFEIFTKRGYTKAEARTLVDILSKDKKTMADILLLEEGDTDENANSAAQSAFWTFAAFICFGILPLITYAFASTALLPAIRKDAFWLTSLLTASTLCFLGWMKAKFTGKEPVTAGIEMVIVGGSAALVSYIIAWVLSTSFAVDSG